MPVIVWLFAMLKGGTRKSTSAIFTAFELAARGEEVLVIDADPKTQGVTDWATRMIKAGHPLPFDVAQWSHGCGLLVQFIAEQVKRTGATRVLIDVGGEAPEVVAQAAIMADLCISPVGAEQAEMGRMEATKTTLVGANRELRHDVLLTRVPRVGEGAASAARDLLDESGYHVLPVEIPQHRGLYADPWGTLPASTGAYAELVSHLLRVEERERASA